MPYTSTTFYDGAPPALTAGEMNKLGAGVLRAETSADTCLALATTAAATASTAVTAAAGRSRVVRLTDGPVVTGTALVLDDVLQVSVTGVADKFFLARFVIIYIADVNLHGALALSVSAGASAYWVSVGSATTGPHESVVLGFCDVASMPVRDLGSTGSPQAMTGYAHIRAGTATTLTVQVRTGEGTDTGSRATAGGGMQILTGSHLILEQLN